MFKILGKICVNNLNCVSVTGEISLLKNGLKLTDDKGNIFIIESIGMPHYTHHEDYKTHAELVLSGEIQNIGSNLSVIE